jgi:P-type conjugative transfer protein TrbG
MRVKRYASLAWLLVAAGLVKAQDPDRAAASSSAYATPPNVAPELTAAPSVAPPSEGLAPDPAATSTGMGSSTGQGNPSGRRSPPGLGSGAVQLPPPIPPAPADTCDTADCTPQGGKPSSVKLRLEPIQIGPPAQRALSESHDWAENPNAMPTRDTGGRVMFPFSESAPTIVCAPVHVCDIELQPGEVVRGSPHVGDSVRWKISPAISGSDEKRVTHLIIKPTEAGLDTNLIVPTDRHTYHIRLVSSSTRFLSSVGFYYPEEDQQSWTDVGKKTSKANQNGSDSSDMPTVAVNRLNFNYRIKVVKGKPEFRPLRAMDDGYHTYISMNEDLPQLEAPILVGISSSGTERIINYRLKGNMYVIDGTLPKIALISGVGREQERVELTRDPCKARGWLGICWDAKE